jgi:hypothetical protein
MIANSEWPCLTILKEDCDLWDADKIHKIASMDLQFTNKAQGINMSMKQKKRVRSEAVPMVKIWIVVFWLMTSLRV